MVMNNFSEKDIELQEIEKSYIIELQEIEKSYIIFLLTF